MAMIKQNINVCLIFIIQLIFIGCERDKNIKPNTFQGLDPNVVVEPDYFKDCQLLEDNNVSNAYVFPIIPGSEEWKQLPSHKARLDACQIPEDILQTMCTYDLVETYFNYPLLWDMIFHYNSNDGLNHTRGGYSGLSCPP